MQTDALPRNLFQLPRNVLSLTSLKHLVLNTDTQPQSKSPSRTSSGRRESREFFSSSPSRSSFHGDPNKPKLHSHLQQHDGAAVNIELLTEVAEEQFLKQRRSDSLSYVNYQVESSTHLNPAATAAASQPPPLECSNNNNNKKEPCLSSNKIVKTDESVVMDPNMPLKALLSEMSQRKGNPFSLPLSENQPSPFFHHFRLNTGKPKKKDTEKESAKKRLRAKQEARTCFVCETTETVEWRRGPDGSTSLCNACGLCYARKEKKFKLMLNNTSQTKMGINNLLN